MKRSFGNRTVAMKLMFLAITFLFASLANMFDGQAQAESMLLGVIVGLRAILVGFVCRLWLRRNLESTRIEDRISRGPIRRIHQLDPVLQVVSMDDPGVLTVHAETLQWYEDECMQERVWEGGTDLQDSFERIQ